MERPTAQSTTWTSTQTYSFSLICLTLGMIVGYLVNAPSHAPATRRPGVQNLQPRTSASMQPTPAQIKHMTDKKAEALMAQLQKDPNNVGLLTEIGKTYFYGRQFSMAAEYYERAAKVKPDPEILTSLGSIYHYAGDDKKAIETLNRALQIDSKFDGALFNLGMIKWRAESDPKAAINAWEKLLATHPNHPKRAEVEAMIASAKNQVNGSSSSQRR